MKRLIYYSDYRKMKPPAIDEFPQWQVPTGQAIRFFFFYIWWDRYSFWFRVFGVGVLGKSLSKPWPMLFSERIGKDKYFRIFGWKFKFLK